jgi:hypothetical protein
MGKHWLRVLENGVLRKIFGTTRENETEGRKIYLEFDCLRERDHLEDLDVDGRIKLKRIRNDLKTFIAI